MSVVVLTRKREQGPGVSEKLIPTGRFTVTNIYGNLIVNSILSSVQSYGFKTVTWDNVHPEYSPGRRQSKRKQRKSEDIGGDFTSFNVYDEGVLRGDDVYIRNSAYGTRCYTGGFIPVNWPAGNISTSDLTGIGQTGKFTGEFGTATELGPQAWNRFKPKLYAADMGQFVGEIRETFPMLRTTSKIFANTWASMFGNRGGLMSMTKTASDQWINLQFGWRPFLSDLRKFFNSFSSFDCRLNQAIRDNGRFIRRGGSLTPIHKGEDGSVIQDPVETSTLIVDTYPNYWGSQYVAPSGSTFGDLVSSPYYSRSRLTYTERYRIWFDGCFRYWVPSFDSPTTAVNIAKNYLRMYGLRITPSLVWNLTPWSWLADWIGNVGENLANYTSEQEDNLTAKYAYIMKETSGEITNRSTINFYDGPVSMEWRRGFVSRTRRHASPFGFSIDWPDFTARQWSILAALGFMRLRV